MLTHAVTSTVVVAVNQAERRMPPALISWPVGDVHSLTDC